FAVFYHTSIPYPTCCTLIPYPTLFRSFRRGKFLGADIFETRHQLKTQQMAKCKSHFALPVRIHKILLYVFVGAMSQETFQHSRNFRGGTARDLRTNTH